MAVTLRTKRPDAILRQIADVLREYEKKHPRADIDIYRQNSVAVRVRVVNPEFARVSRAEREDEVIALIEKLPEDVIAEVSLLLLLTPEEAKKSIANLEFDNPIPSKI